MQRLGQHFLKNISVLNKIAGALHLAPGDFVIEIGPGHGELTDRMIALEKNITVAAIEKDRTLIEALRGKFGDEAVIEGDALKMLSQAIEALKGKKYKIAGNIPYYITGKLLRTIGELPTRPELVVLLIQKEVAERICAEPPKMNRLAASVQAWAAPKIIGLVGKENFSPQPKVESAIIALAPNGAVDDHDLGAYYRALRAIFSQPRKTILNNLAELKLEKRILQDKLEEIGILPGGRPQDLSIENIASIGKAFFAK